MNYYQLADLVARIKIGYKSHLVSVKVNKNKLSINFLYLLHKEGLIRSFFVLKNQREILIYLKYVNKIPLIYDLKIVSKPSKRVYYNLNVLSKNYRKNSLSNFYIISTSKGLITSNDAILKDFVSGEILCKIQI